jgi:predicted CoA-substrate-specific enzyme activase
VGYFAGIDGGSVSIKVAVLDASGSLVDAIYRRHRGRPLECALEILPGLLQKYDNPAAAFTGSSGKLLAQGVGAEHVNELAAHAESCARLLPGVNTVFEMGGEDSKLLLLDDGHIKDFSLNSICAAGTGSFLDQQAERMNLSIEEFAALSLESERPPRIAGRCSVFAKSDMIHLQQIATPLADIVAGLCFSVARNFRGSIVRGRPLRPRVSFMGGVALNQGMVRAFKEVFRLNDLVVPEHVTQMGAIGACLKAMAEGSARTLDLEALRRAARRQALDQPAHPPLLAEGDRLAERHFGERSSVPPRDRPGRAYLGIDVGSISTNLAVIDESGRVLSKRYLRTASRPIEAVRTGLAEVGAELAGRYGQVPIHGVATTGSGRYMIADFVGADVVKNEITAQATAAAFIDPKVDTIFEIGGQDSKFISLKDGVIADFEMNKACAAGTGSFLEEQAEKLGVSIKGEFAEMALAAEEPCGLGERCTVFMENSLQANLQKGAEKPDLLAGLAYSIVENYINRVVSGRPIGRNIFFQGGTAFNKSVVAAFEKFLDKEIVVPPDHDVTGAIGMAMIARDHMRETGEAESGFRGWDLATVPYTQSSFECKGCENRCEINKVKIQGEDTPLFYGGRCEKYDIRRKTDHGIEDLFAFRQEALEAEHQARDREFAESGREPVRGRIGLPYVFFFHDMLPYFSVLLWELGFEPVLSPRTSSRVTQKGVEKVLADTCYPIKAALGHVTHLLEEEGVDTLFLPSFVNLSRPGDAFRTGLGCPLTQSFPYQVRAAEPQARVIAPPIDLRQGGKKLRASLKEALAPFRVRGRELKKAMARAEAAQTDFEDRIRTKGRAVLDGLQGRALVIIGRPYNAFDPGMNLDVPSKLASLGQTAIPMDFLPPQDVHDTWPHMYWRSGQRILQAARTVKNDPRLYPLFIGNFSCGPDSFIQKFFDEELAGHPALHLEIDEHSADAGVITRCEAFLDSIDSSVLTGTESARQGWTPDRPYISQRDHASRRVVYMPRMSDHALGLAAAFRACGVDCRVMPPTDNQAVSLARRFVSGKECYPCAVTTGDMLKQTREADFDPERAAFFMPNGAGPCRFGQYNVFQRMVLDKAGFEQVPLFSPMQDESLYRELGIVGNEFTRLAWRAVVAHTLLLKSLHQVRPVEVNPGQADAVYQRYLEKLSQAITASGSNGSGTIESTLDEMRRDFADIPTRDEKRPLIGIVGEIFVRSNPFSNEDVVRKVEELGGKAWLAPVDEWILYIAWIAKRNAKRNRDLGNILETHIKDWVQKRELHSLEHRLDDFLETAPEPPVEEVLDKARDYVHDSFEGEAILSVGKAVDMCESGVHGIINAMPFGCMPGTISSAILSSVGKKYGVPIIAVPYDGTASPTTRLTLETFMEQAKARV